MLDSNISKDARLYKNNHPGEIALNKQQLKNKHEKTCGN